MAMAADNEIVTTRLLKAPRELVFRAFTDPAQVGLWWGPAGFTITTHEMRVAPGGRWRFMMHGPDGVDYPNRIDYREVVEPERLVYDLSDDDETKPTSFHIIVSFEAQGEHTLLTMRAIFENAAVRNRVVTEANAIEGGIQTVDRLEAHLAVLQGTSGERDFFITRVFDAPRTLVWKAWTEAGQIARWWGPNSFSNPVCEMDLRPGGAYRVVMRSPDGADYPITGEVREVVAPALLVMTLDCAEHPAEWHAMVRAGSGRVGPNPAGLMVQTVRFEERGHQTRLSISTRFESVALRDAMVKMGMNEGWSQSLDRLAQHLHAA
jgi:uncharacterized protein YndB with AHSA1/START domain